jgi:hypothetical protein
MSEEQGFQLPTPGHHHELLQPFEGTFKAEVQMWMGPGDPMVSSGMIENTFQLGGLYLHQKYLGDRTDGPFPNFAGYGYWGYNTATNEYQGFWIDNASTIMQLETGNVDESGKIWEMKSEIVLPGSESAMQKRTIFTVLGNDHHTMESFVTPPGAEESRNMFIDYKRS